MKSEILYIGGVSPSVDPATIRTIYSNAETEDALDGEVLRRFDYVSRVSPAAIRPSELVSLRQRSDDLADDVVDFLQLKFGQDAYTTLLDQLALPVVEPCIQAFWDDVNREPPVGVTAFPMRNEGSDSKGARGVEDGRPDEAMRNNNRYPEPTLAEGQAVFWRYSGQIFTSLLHFSLAGGFSSPRLGAVMRETGYLTSAHNEATYKRLLETTLFVLDAMTDMTVGTGRGWKSAIRVRILHAQVRRRIAGGKGKLNTYDSDVCGIPINQADLATVLGSFMIAPLWSAKRTGITLSPQECSAYQAAWRHVGFYLGCGPELLERCYGQDFATAEVAFASLAFDAFPETKPVDGLLTPTYRILSAVSNRPPRASTVGYHCEYSRTLLGGALADQLGIPRGTAREQRKVSIDMWSGYILTEFGRRWRKGWEAERMELFRELIYLLTVWQLGERRTTFAWRSDERRDQKLGEDEGEEPGIKMGKEVGIVVKRRWAYLIGEMVVVCGVVGVGSIVGVGLLLRGVSSRF